MKDSAFSSTVVRALKKRSGGVCEHCGVNEAREAHHRQYRSRRGPSTLSNALHLCGRGNTSGCHGKAHSGAIGETTGLAIRSGHTPSRVPFFRLFDGTWWLLDDDGGKEQMKATDATELLTLIGAIREGVMR